MNIRNPVIVFLFCSLFSILKISAKAVLLNEDAGLSNIEVTSIAKDKKGLMWIATKRGLNTYDGYSFTPIHYFDKLSVNTILYDSTRNIIWVGTDLGLQYISCEDGRIIQCTPLSQKNPVVCLGFFQSNLIVGFQRNYILRITPSFSCKVIYRFSKQFLKVNLLGVDSKGDVVVCFEPEKKIISVNIHSLKIKNIANPFPNRSVDVLSVVNDVIYLGGVDKGFWSLDANTRMGLTLKSLNAIRQDPEYMLEQNQSVLIGYRNSTKVIEIDKRTLSVVNITAAHEEVFSNKRIYCLYRDEFNVLWTGTSKGLIKLTPDKPKPNFEKLFCNPPGGNVSTRQIIEDANGDIYIASYAGLYRFNKKAAKWTNLNQIHYLGKYQPFSQRSLVNVNDQYMYIGSDAYYFVRYNKYTHSIENLIVTSVDGLCDTRGSTLTMAEDKTGIIWLGSEKGLMSFDPRKIELKCHYKDNFSLGESFVRYICMLPDRKQFWVGTENGIYLVDIHKGVMLQLNENTTPALSSNFINAISLDVSGNIWIATDDAGMNVLSSDYKEIYTLTKKDGLSSNEVYHMLWQDSIRLWISTYNGLNYYNTQTKTILSYYKTDGITDNEFNQNSAMKSADGKMYFGGINGITCFYPPQMETQQHSFNVFTSAITKWEKTSGMFKNVFAVNDNQLVMNPGDNLLTLSFGANDYTSTELITYFYKIEGLHDRWISLGSQPTLRLESLKGGEYKLLIKATRGSRGVESINVLTYNLIIDQAFYQTIWFYLLIAFVLACISYYYFSSRLKTQKKLELLRIQIASNLHDEVGSLLTRITMSADRLVTRMSRDSETRDKLEGVSELSRAANVAMSDVLWTIDARNDFTGNLTDRMREHAEDLLLPRGIDVSIDFSDIDHFKQLSPEFRQHLFLLYKEVINNIIKHSKASSVSIIYRQSKKQSLLSVINDGVIDRDGSVNTGQGLRNIKMRAEMLKGNAVVKQTGGFFEVHVTL